MTTTPRAADAALEPDLDFDFAALLEPFPEGLDLDSLLADLSTPDESDNSSSLSDPPPPVEDSGGSPGLGSGWVSEIESFLLAEGEGKEAAEVVGGEGFEESFFAGLLGDASDGGEEGTAAASESEESEGKEKSEAPTPAAVDAEEEIGGDDPINKKRRRQMRNRDSAMKSRERKKMYFKELEMKSRYLESECRRLDHALRCCMAENLTLHQCLQRERASIAPVAKQESAVLFVESLLLGSLFWLVSIVSLFLVPSLPRPDQKDASRLGSGLAQQASRVARLASNGLFPDLGLGLVVMRRRYRGMRTKMKFCLSLLHAVYP